MQIISSLIFSLVITLIIELIISLVLGIRGEDLLKIIFINILTNIPLNIIVNLLYLIIDYSIVFYILVPIFEVIVIIIEGKYYKRINNIIGNYKLSILLNIFSYGYGFIYIIISNILK